jgi:translation initiation factor 1
MSAKKDDDRAASPFAKLVAMRDSLPPGPPLRPAPGATSPAGTPLERGSRLPEAATNAAGLAGKIVVRFERKGHGGKTVTIVSGVGAKFAEAIASEMKKALGCGARVEDGDIVLQGDLVPRAIAFLEKRGAVHLVDGSAPKKKG